MLVKYIGKYFEESSYFIDLTNLCYVITVYKIQFQYWKYNVEQDKISSLMDHIFPKGKTRFLLSSQINK